LKEEKLVNIGGGVLKIYAIASAPLFLAPGAAPQPLKFWARKTFYPPIPPSP